MTPSEQRTQAGICQCGCGQPTAIIQENRSNRGEVKGQPRRFVHGHANTCIEANLARRRNQLDAKPFCEWLATLPGSPQDIAALLHVNERRVRGWLNGELEAITLTVVDNAITAYGDPGLLHTLYPLTDTEATA